MNYDYLIAGLPIRLNSGYPLMDNWESKLFRVQEEVVQPIWQCNIQEMETLPFPKGKLLMKTDVQRLYLEGNLLWYQILNRQNAETLFTACYSLEHGQNASLWASGKEKPYIARMEHIWAAVDFPYQLLKNNILTLHSAVIEVKDEVILFLAPSGTGKSTQAELWHKLRGARQLNGDKAALRIENGRLYACGLPFSGTSGICEDYHLPVKAMVQICRSEQNNIKQLYGLQAVSAIMGNCFGHRMIPGCGHKVLNLLYEILNLVKVYTLFCTPDERAVCVLEKELWEEC